MSTNGKRKPPRPKLQVIQPAANPQQAAAITAALQQFLIETTPVAQPSETLNAWQRQALLESTGETAGGLNPWGDTSPWGKN